MLKLAKSRSSLRVFQLKYVGTFLPDVTPETFYPKSPKDKSVTTDFRTGPQDVGDKEILEEASGTPTHQLGRTVLITQESKSANQSGRNRRQEQWTVTFKREEGMWTNPLMGWSSSRDPMYQIHKCLVFDSFEEAKTWAITNGFQYEAGIPTEDLHTRSNGGDYSKKFVYRPPRSNFTGDNE